MHAVIFPADEWFLHCMRAQPERKRQSHDARADKEQENSVDAGELREYRQNQRLDGALDDDKKKQNAEVAGGLVGAGQIGYGNRIENAGADAGEYPDRKENAEFVK